MSNGYSAAFLEGGHRKFRIGSDSTQRVLICGLKFSNWSTSTYQVKVLTSIREVRKYIIVKPSMVNRD